MELIAFNCLTCLVRWAGIKEHIDKRYIIQYSTIVPYYVKVDHNLTFINSMTLIDTNKDKEERRTKVSVCCYW
jgi:hypothetical protein